MDRKDKEFIELPDGTKFRNPAWIKPLPELNSNRPPRLNSNSNYEVSPKALENQAKIQQLYFELQASALYDKAIPGSELFKLALTSPENLAILSLTIFAPEQKTDDKELPTRGPDLKGVSPKLLVPWPPDSKTTQRQAVSLEEINKAVIQKMTPEAVAKWREQFRAIANLQLASWKPNARSPDLNQKPPAKPKDVRARHGITPEREKEVSALAEKARALLLDEIARGRPLNALSADEKSMYAKVKSVSVEQLTEKLDDHPLCARASPNAFYDSTKHKISICPNFYNYPNKHLMFVFAHELAHSIDNCNVHNHLVRFTEPMSLGDWKEVHAAAAQKGIELQQIPEVSSSASKVNQWQLAWQNSSKSEMAWNFLVQQGMVDRGAEGVPANRNPYGAALRCLAGKVGVRVSGGKEFQSFVREMKRSEKSSLIAEPDVDVNSLIEAHRLNPHCVDSPRDPSQLRELSADLWASRVIGRYVELHPFTGEEDKMGAFGIFWQDTCDTKTAGVSEGHPHDRERIDGVILADPRVQKAFGCKTPGGNDVCLKMIGTIPSSKMPSVENSTPAGSPGATGVER